MLQRFHYFSRVNYSQVQQLVGTCIEAMRELSTTPGPAMLTIAVADPGFKKGGGKWFIGA